MAENDTEQKVAPVAEREYVAAPRPKSKRATVCVGLGLMGELLHLPDGTAVIDATVREGWGHRAFLYITLEGDALPVPEEAHAPYREVELIYRASALGDIVLESIRHAGRAE